MPNPKNILIGGAVIIGLAAALPLVFPYDAFKSDLENTLSTINGGKTTIAKIEFSYQPAPVFTLRNVVIDSADAAQIAEVLIPVTSYNLLNFSKSIRDVTIRNATFSRRFALDLPNRIKSDSNKGVQIDRLKLEQASVKLESSTVGPVDGELHFNPDGSIGDLVIRADQGRAEIQVQPASAGEFKVQFNAKGWELPFTYPVKFDFLKLMGTANADGLQIPDIRGDIYGGIVTGSAQLSWGQEWVLTGQLFSKSINVEPLMTIFSPITRSTGRMNSDVTFKYQSPSYHQLFKEPQIQGRFIIQDGTLHNFDLITPLKSQSPTVLRRGGQTNFSSLAGGIAINSNSIKLSNLILESGKLRSRGNVVIQNGKISGSVASQLAAGAIIVSNNLSIAGLLSAPELRSEGANRPQSETINNTAPSKDEITE
ncbi:MULTISPECIES: AsmA-like C-terminal region-containing protein [Deefgea]|uniref:AsmA family protein n=1 Tax=Deefgea chitinilytica TaxID=570276 RepID=A0ABS2CCW7_9NEIS|nr:MULTISPECIES: AsmA-like C-terminal region-containing protein [Deefgea]MBM5571997.1 hypothetical protein [Deefgea chitinilytica]MBM9889232.1 hypothetical protein [Deefgea sp. CFH1-16]